MALIHIGGKSYELIHENRNGWNPESFRNRYSEVLERYDYIIGDWGYNQLRLKGFFRDNHQKANKDSTFSAIPDYINEYCNFGCAYFILEKQHGARREPSEEDLELEAGDETVRLEGYDLRAAAESAVSLTAEAELTEAMQPPVREAVQQPQRQRNQRHEGHGRQPGNNDGRRRDQPYRKNNRGGNDQRGKKPLKIAANEAAAASEAVRNPKDAGRS